MKSKNKNSKKWRILWLVVFLGIWYAVTETGICSSLLVPGIGSVLAALLEDLRSGALILQIARSTGFVAAGLLISIALGLFMAMPALNHPIVDGLVSTLCMLGNPLPAMAILPLIIIWFGAGYTSMLFIIIHAVLWPMLLNISAGIKSVPDIYVETAHCLNLSRPRIFFEIYVPSSLPYLLAGIQIGWARAWRALISAEMIFGAIGGSGIGYYIFKNRVMMDTPRLYAGIVVVIIIGACVEKGLRFLERVTIGHWGMTRV